MNGKGTRPCQQHWGQSPESPTGAGARVGKTGTLGAWVSKTDVTREGTSGQSCPASEDKSH